MEPRFRRIFACPKKLLEELSQRERKNDILFQKTEVALIVNAFATAAGLVDLSPPCGIKTIELKIGTSHAVQTKRAYMSEIIPSNLTLSPGAYGTLKFNLGS